jgi:hypothetical protein
VEGILLPSDEMRPTIVVLEAAALFDVHLGQITDRKKLFKRQRLNTCPRDLSRQPIKISSHKIFTARFNVQAQKTG